MLLCVFVCESHRIVGTITSPSLSLSHSHAHTLSLLLTLTHTRRESEMVLHRSVESYMTAKNLNTETFQASSAVRQWGNEWSGLFNLFLDWLNDWFKCGMVPAHWDLILKPIWRIDKSSIVRFEPRSKCQNVNYSESAHSVFSKFNKFLICFVITKSIK